MFKNVINPKLHKPRRKINKGDVEDIARQNAEHKSKPLTEKGRRNYDEINWRSKKGLPPLSKCRYTTHTKANLPVFGDP